jgi:hypothetical protein
MYGNQMNTYNFPFTRQCDKIKILKGVVKIGAGFELFKWAAERGLEIPLLVFSLIVLILLIVIATGLENEPCFTSLCRNCKYEKEKQRGCTLSCSSYKPKLLFMRRRRSQCPFNRLIEEGKVKER